MRRLARPAVFAGLLYLAIGIFVAHGLWPHPGARVLLDNGRDQDLCEWWLAWDAHALAHLHNPLFTAAMNSPDGVNSLGNTSLLLVGLPLAPVTWLFGPGATYALLVTLAPALVGLALYAALRRFDLPPAAAAAGGLLGALAPGLRSQSLGHLHMLLAALVPLIAAEVLAIATGRTAPRRGGIRLAALVTAQLLLGEEWLAITAVACALLCAALALAHRDRALAAGRRLGEGVATALAVAAPALALLLAWQFLGPQHYRGSPFTTSDYSTDLAALVTPSKLEALSTGASNAHALRLPGGLSEQTAYLGWALIAWCGGVAVALRADRRVRALLGAAAALLLLALGPDLLLDGHRHRGLPLPWGALDGLPLLDQMLPVRMALAIPLLLAPVVAIAVQRGRAAVVLTALALVPMLPRPLETGRAEPAPAVLAHRLAPPGRAVLFVPVVSPTTTAPLRWEAERGLRDRIAGAYAIVPDQGGHAAFTPLRTPVLDALATVAVGGRPRLDEPTRAAILADMRRMRVATVVATPSPQRSAYVAFLSALLGPPSAAGTVSIWRVRASSATITSPKNHGM